MKQLEKNTIDMKTCMVSIIEDESWKRREKDWDIYWVKIKKVERKP